MGMEYSEVSWQETSSWQEPSLFATFSHLQEQVERLVGPLFERRSQKDRRRSVRDLFGIGSRIGRIGGGSDGGEKRWADTLTTPPITTNYQERDDHTYGAH